MFRNWPPSREELVASGEGANFDLHGEFRELRPFVEEIKRGRRRSGTQAGRGIPALCDRPAGPFPPGKRPTRTRRWTRTGVTLPQSGGTCS